MDSPHWNDRRFQALALEFIGEFNTGMDVWPSPESMMRQARQARLREGTLPIFAGSDLTILPAGVTSRGRPETRGSQVSGIGLMAELPRPEGGNQDHNRDNGEPTAEATGSDLGDLGLPRSNLQESLPAGRQSLRIWEGESEDGHNPLPNNPTASLEEWLETSYPVPNLLPPRELLGAPPPRNPWDLSIDIPSPVPDVWFPDPVLLNSDVPDVLLVDGSGPGTPPLVITEN